MGVRLLLVACAASTLACGVSDEGRLPPDVQDPATLQTPGGAMALYYGAIDSVAPVIDRLATQSGILTDELVALPTPLGVAGAYTAVDSRQDTEGFAEGTYNSLHRLRAQAREARAFLAAYAPDTSPALQGHMFAIEGYAEIFLADLFCSGVPLSTVDIDDNYTLAAGSTTAEIYAHAAELLDSAAGLMGDSTGWHHFAAIGRGRALLGLNQVDAAAAAVVGVPSEYVYQATVIPLQASPTLLQSFVNGPEVNFLTTAGVPHVADGEGGNGVDYRSSGDPRSRADAIGQDQLGGTMWFPAKYPQSGPVTVTIASGIEARLIEAEAALRAGGDWLTALNALRTSGTFHTQPNADDPGVTDTIWHAGAGGVDGLAPLEDPGSPVTRADLLFRERALWLYLTGHRQGDLRRLIRQYPGRSSSSEYPTGFYQGAGGTYGDEITFPVPEKERRLNPKYTGCFHRNA